MKSGLFIDVRKLVAPDGIESLRVEYKAEWNHVCGSAALRTVCAFANDVVNAGGGYVVLGVDEQDGRPVLPARGLPRERLDEIQKEIQGQINRIEPTYVPMIVPEQVGDAVVLVLWCPGGDARPYRAPESLAKGSEKRSYIRNNSQTREAKGDLLRQLQEVASSTPFDDRGCYEASVDDLDPALLQQHLVKVGSRLAGDRAELAERAERLYLLKRVNGHSVPRNLALLFFSEEPRRWFRGAAVEIAQLPGGRGGDEIFTWTIEGPLPTLLKQSLDQLRGLMPSEIRKHADRAEADRIEAWPFAAVEEALVNAVHHRGYDVPDPIKVTLLPDALEIVSYPGPMPGLSLQDVREGRSRPVQARNRRVAELLRDLRLAEARGTGLARIRSEMQRNGSPPPEFDFDEDARSYFQVRLPIHPAFLRAKATARPAQPLRIGRPAPPEEVVGRDALIAQVKRTLEAQSVALVGPPGRGVSTLLGAVAASLGDARVFQLDLSRVNMAGLDAALVTWAGEQSPAIIGPRLTPDAVFAALDDRPLVFVLDRVDAFGLDEDNFDPPQEWWKVILGWLQAYPRLRIVAGCQSVWGLFGDEWVGWSEPMPVPPLGRSHALTLARCLLDGCHLPDDPVTADSVAEVSAGIPDLIVRVVGQLNVWQRSGPDCALEALDTLGLQRGDPTGLVGRVKAYRSTWISQSIGRHFGSRGALLDLVAQDVNGRRRLDLIASAVSEGHARLDVLQALRTSELDGSICEVDGMVRFEHPWIRDAWLQHRKSPPRTPYDDEDVPF